MLEKDSSFIQLCSSIFFSKYKKVLKCYYWNIIIEMLLKYYGIIPIVSLIKIEV